MTTKPKLKKIPLPEGWPALPEGSVNLGHGNERLEDAFLDHMDDLKYYCSGEDDEWDQGFWAGSNKTGFYAAPADSAIAREILGEPAKPATKRKAAKKTITKPSKTVTKPAKAKKPVTLDLSKESVGSALVAAAQTASFGIEFCESADRLGITLPNWLPALPPLPAGYDRWEPRGAGYYGTYGHYAATSEKAKGRWSFSNGDATYGFDSCFYIEAVRDEKPETATDNASVHIELHQKEIDSIGLTAPHTAEELATYWAQKGEEIRRDSAVGLLTEAAETIGARAAERDVGSERSMAKCVAAFNVFFADAVAKNGGKLTEEQGWRFMELLKLSRSTVGQKRDDYLDGAAYACLAGESALNQEKP